MQDNKHVAFYTLGCKLNFSETSAIGRQFNENGFKTVDFSSPADIYVINTCSVTDNADKKCRKVIKQALKINPEAFIAVIGCYAQLKPEEIAGIPGVDVVLGAKEKFRLLDYITDLTKKPAGEAHACEIEEANFFTNAYSFGERTRSFLKVQDGCDYSCSFCTIPLARGKSRSDTVENIVASAKEIAVQGIKEIVLTGVNIGDFGKKAAGSKQREETFYDLIYDLDKVKGIERFRISSIEPNLLTNEIIEFVANSERFMPHFHIPLQSGSDKILKMMRRRYLRELYSERVSTIKKLMPHCCIGVDVIVGFPGETNEDFIDTYEFINSLDISYLHVFTYSERNNTLAIDMDNAVPAKVRSKRSRMLRTLSEKKKRYFYEQHLGTSRKTLWEAEQNDDVMYGFTDNYIKVKAPYDEKLVNQIKSIRLNKVDADAVIAAEAINQQ